MIVHGITLNPAVSQGKPTLRNMRFTLAQLLELLAPGMTHDEILDDYSFLEAADIQAALQYAACITTPNRLPRSRIIYLRLGNTRNRELTAFFGARWTTIHELLLQDSGMLVLNHEQIISY